VWRAVTANASSRSVLRLALIGAAVVVVTLGLRAAENIVNTIFLALFLALITLPLFDILRRRGVTTWLALTLVITGMLIVIVATVAFFVIALTRLAETLPKYQEQLTSQIANLREFLSRFGIDISSVTANSLFQPTRSVEFVASFIEGIISALTSTGFILFLIAYMLIEAASFSARLRTGLGADNPVLGQIRVFIHGVSVYAARKAILGGAAAIADTVLLLALGVDFAILWGVLSFILSFIPNIGFLISLIPPVVLALIQLGPGKALIVLIGYILINGTCDNVIGPRYMGEGVNLSPLVTFIVVMYWSWVLGAAGAFLALPLTIMVKLLILDQYADTRWLGLLISMDDGRGSASDGRGHAIAAESSVSGPHPGATALDDGSEQQEREQWEKATPHEGNG
jgi:predicted PurR-regulated permease PerM